MRSLQVPCPHRRSPAALAAALVLLLDAAAPRAGAAPAAVSPPSRATLQRPRTGEPSTPPASAPASSPATRRGVSPHNVVAPPGYRAARLLPDSVLVRIDGREDVTVRRFRRAVGLLGGNPDSLTPADRDRFLDLVLEQRVLAAEAMKRALPWPHPDSAVYEQERDNILLRAALADRLAVIEAARRAAGQPDVDEQAMGMAARDSLMRELKPTWNDELLKRVGRAFAALPQPTPQMGAREQMALMGRVPEVASADTGGVIVRSSLGELTVAEMLRDWKRLATIYRPSVPDAEAVRGLAANSLFERMLRREAQSPALQQRPEVAGVIADRIEYHAVANYLQTTLVSKIPMDSVALLRFFNAHRAQFARPARSILILLLLPDRAAADSVARSFSVPGEAESLAFRAQRGGVSYTHAVTAESDSALFARTLAMDVGAVGGPDPVEGGWRVFKVLEHDPRSPQPFAAVRENVKLAWYQQESERLIRGELDRLKRLARLERNDRALRALVLAATSPHR